MTTGTAARTRRSVTVRDGVPGLLSYNQFSTLASIRARTTVISGGADLLTPPSHSRDLAAAIPGATHVHIPTAGHMLPHEASHEVTDAISRTIATGIGTDPAPTALVHLLGQRHSQFAMAA